jgi:hypothetical protein
MKKVIITIETTNAAFDDDGHFEVARILRKLAVDLECEVGGEILRDINGNKVGMINLGD